MLQERNWKDHGAAAMSQEDTSLLFTGPNLCMRLFFLGMPEPPRCCLLRAVAGDPCWVCLAKSVVQSGAAAMSAMRIEVGTMAWVA